MGNPLAAGWCPEPGQSRRVRHTDGTMPALDAGSLFLAWDARPRITPGTSAPRDDHGSADLDADDPGWSAPPGK